LRPVDLSQALAACEHLLRADPFNVPRLCAVGAALRDLDRPTESRKCYKAALSVLQRAIRARDAEAALAFELVIHRAFVAPVESEQHYYRCYSDWRDDMIRLGRSFRISPSGGARNPRRVGFVLPTGTLLGHTDVLLRFLAQQRADRNLGIDCAIYVLYEWHDAFIEAARSSGVDPVFAERELPQGRSASHLERLQWLRERLHRDDRAVAVWVTYPPGALFALSMRLAPVQIFWALRFHPVSGPFIDGHLSYGRETEIERMIGKQAWRVCPVPLAGELRAAAPPAAKELRASYHADVVLGTLARAEKLNSGPFLAAVAQVLQANPGAIWLWTGREVHPGIEAHMRAAGVASQCRFVGWIDTALYAGALDVFLESFPMGCGITGYQALAARTALLSYLSETTIYGMHFGDAPALDNERLQDPLLCAGSPREYVDLASKLVADAEFRHEVGLRGHEFYLRELGKLGQYTERFFGSIARVADETLASPAMTK